MRYNLCLLYFVLASIFFSPVISAQPEDLDPIFDPELLRELAPNYNIVYLIAEDVTTSDYASPEWMREQLSVDVIHTWEELRFYDDVLGIDGLIIHNSAVEMVDSEWLIQTYHRGLVLTAINVPSVTVATWLQREGLTDRYTLLEDDTVFITTRTMNVRRALDGTGLGDVAIWTSDGSRVNQLSAEEGRISFVIMVNDIRELQHQQRYLIDDLLD